jgi:3-hydroxyisobutyrate dehydrogenase
MGGHMSANLVAAGHRLLVHDLNDAAVRRLVDLGAERAESVAALAEQCDVVITMLPGPPEVEGIIRRMAPLLRPGAVWVDMSTSTPAAARVADDVLAERGVFRLDAPVSGMAKGAASGTLQIFVGGDADVLAQVRPLFDVMGDPERVLHVGGLGAGYTVKLMINQLWFSHLVASAEVLTVGLKAGVDLEVLHCSLLASPAANSFLANDLPSIFVGDYDESFANEAGLQGSGPVHRSGPRCGRADTAVGACRADLSHRAGQVRPGLGRDDPGAARRGERRSGTAADSGAGDGGMNEHYCGYAHSVHTENWDITTRTQVIAGAGSVARLGGLLHERGARHVLIVTDPGLRKTGMVDDIASAITTTGIGVAIHSEIPANPSTASLDVAAAVARDTRADFVVAIGGGSALDAAKAVALLANTALSAESLDGTEEFGAPTVPLAAIPTTAGTGSETNGFGVMESADHRKVYIGTAATTPELVILDAELTLGLPVPVTAAAGFDAIIHGAESLLSQGATSLSRAYATESLRLTTAALTTAVADGGDIEARSRMLIGARGGLRPRRRDHHLRYRGAGTRTRQRHRIRPGRIRLHPPHLARPALRRTVGDRHGRREPRPGLRPRRPIRRRQGIGPGPRGRSAGYRGISRNQVPRGTTVR